MAYRIERNGWQYICLPDPDRPGEEKRVSLRTRDAAAADEIVADYNASARLGLIGLATNNKRHNPPLGELFDKFLKYSAKHKHPNTHTHNKIYVEKFLRPTFGHIRAMDLTAEHVEGFVGELKSCTPPYHPETINKRLKCLRQVLKRAARPGGTIPRVPVDISEFTLKTPRSLPKYVTPENFARWLVHVNKPINRLRAVMEICTGIPDSELARLKWDIHYDTYNGVLRYMRAKTEIEIVVSLNAWAKEAIAKLLEIKNGPYIFHGVKEARVAYEVASKNSGVKVSPHMLRHSFATWALSAGETMQAIQRVMGHADIATTQIYARLLPNFLADTTSSIDRLRPPDLPKTIQIKKAKGQSKK